MTSNLLLDVFRDSGDRTFVIAEIGVNHNGDLALGRQLIDAAVDCGVDAVKFQSFRAENLVSRDAPKAEYQKANDPDGASQFEMLKKLELDEAGHIAMKEHCDRRGICFLSTPFDEEAADMLAHMGVAGFKISSGDLTNLPLLGHIAAKGLPMIVSTGMATMDEVREAVEMVAVSGDPPLALLQCVSNYPADPATANLRAMQAMKDTFDVVVGWSDHMMGATVSIGAVALGARIIEKHITLDCALPGPDHRASTEPGEFKALVEQIREMESALGNGEKQPVASELAVAKVARRSLVARVALAKGTVLRDSDLTMKRPGGGLSGNAAKSLVGKTLNIDIAEGQRLSMGMIE